MFFHGSRRQSNYIYASIAPLYSFSSSLTKLLISDSAFLQLLSSLDNFLCCGFDILKKFGFFLSMIAIESRQSMENQFFLCFLVVFFPLKKTKPMGNAKMHLCVKKMQWLDRKK